MVEKNLNKNEKKNKKWNKIRKIEKFKDICDRSGAVFERIVEMSCPLEDLRKFAFLKSKNDNEKSNNKWVLQRMDVLSMQLVLDNAITCGLNDFTCWKYIIRSA